MNFTWLCLLFAAPLLLSAASSEYVSLKCNDTEAVSGKSVTIHCTYTLKQNCMFIRSLWNDTHGNIKCNADSVKYTCEEGRGSQLSLTIRDVGKEESYTVNIRTTCGIAKSPHVKVKIINPESFGSSNTTPGPSQTIKTHVPVFLGIVVLVIALGLFGALFGKKIINHINQIQSNRINKETPQDNDRDSLQSCMTIKSCEY